MTTTIAAEAERERDHALPGKEHVTMCITWHAVTQMLRESSRLVLRDKRTRRCLLVGDDQAAVPVLVLTNWARKCRILDNRMESC
jgi:hypothetical protein